MSTPTNYKRVVLNSRPVADIEPDTFRTDGKGQVLVQCTWLSLDPAMRGWLKDARSYLPPVQIGETMRAQGVGVVIITGPESKLEVGDEVTGTWGENDQRYVPPGATALDFLNTLGTSDVGKLKTGETLIVSGAAGSVGSLVCQLGKAAGAKVYAIAGSEDKCEWLVKDIGVDGAFNYKSPTFFNDIKKIGYLDVFFDNVGGEILDFLLTRLNKNARIVLCDTAKPNGLQNYLTLIAQRAKIEGFIVFDYTKQYPVAIKELSQDLSSGKIKRKFHIVEGGVEAAPKALPMLFNGGNTGKLVVKVSGAGDAVKKGKL
ncbi:hypothetical protein BDQ17DRAFT_1390336 [Cyathus striatus]|nr:hypothetical protein BDQ17DRAFT_1390336 [Cyathus striatus]